MIYTVVGFLVVIGILILISTISPKDKTDDEEMDSLGEDLKEDIIDFRKSDSVPDDLEKLKEKINEEVTVYKSTKKLISSLSLIAVIIIAGIFIILPFYIREANNNLRGSKGKTTSDIIKEINEHDKDKENENDKEEIKINFETLKIKEKKLYENATLLDDLVTSEIIIKNFEYSESQNSNIEFILVDKNKSVYKFNSSNDMKLFLDDEKYLNANFEKRFVLDSLGEKVEKYIYTFKK